MEKEKGDQARGASVTSDREEILRARKAAEETRARMEGDDHCRLSVRGDFSSLLLPAPHARLKKRLFILKTPSSELIFSQPKFCREGRGRDVLSPRVFTVSSPHERAVISLILEIVRLGRGQSSGYSYLICS